MATAARGWMPVRPEIWRAFERPRPLDGAPDYTEASLARQLNELQAYHKRLAALDPKG
jgi:hypothetical protein